MHLAGRAYLLVLLGAVLGIVAIWSSGHAFAELWRIPVGLLLLGLALEGVFVRRAPIDARVEVPPRAFLGRPQPAAYVFSNRSARDLAVEYAPVTPPGFAAFAGLRRVRAPAQGTIADEVTLLPVRLGPQPWPRLPARVLGPF